MVEPIKAHFIIKLGFRKAGKVKELALRMDSIHSRVKAATGKGLNCQYFKRPWQMNMIVDVEGHPETVRQFLHELRLVTETIGLTVSPEDWWRI